MGRILKQSKTQIRMSNGGVCSQSNFSYNRLKAKFANPVTGIILNGERLNSQMRISQPYLDWPKKLSINSQNGSKICRKLICSIDQIQLLLQPNWLFVNYF